jgi:hypothetical protein
MLLFHRIEGVNERTFDDACQQLLRVFRAASSDFVVEQDLEFLLVRFGRVGAF